MLELPVHGFESVREANLFRTDAEFARARARRELHQLSASLRDFEQSANLGMRLSAFELGKLMESAASQNPDTASRNAQFDSALKWFTMAAELGDTDAMKRLKYLYRGRRKAGQGHRGDLDWENYWWLLSELGHTSREAPELIARFVSRSQQIFESNDVKSLERSIKKLALSWRSVSAGSLPGRSFLTCAFVDTLMRRQLEFVWRAFYDPAQAKHQPPNVNQVFDNHKVSTPKTPFCEHYQLVVSNFSASLPDAISVDRTLLAAILMPCDNLFSLDRDNAHYATLWSVEPDDDSVLILDPFPEFWHPEQNSSISAWKIIDYKYFPAARTVEVG